MIPIFFESRGRGARELTRGGSARLRRLARWIASCSGLHRDSKCQLRRTGIFQDELGVAAVKREAALRLIENEAFRLFICQHATRQDRNPESPEGI